MIGVNGTERGEDAVAFVRRLGAFAGGRLVLTDAFPYDDLRGRHTSLAYREALREDSQAMLVAVRDPLRSLLRMKVKPEEDVSASCW
jgi:hypothetical protein